MGVLRGEKLGFAPYSVCKNMKKWRISAGLRAIFFGFCPALLLILCIKYKK